ncbi:hypothetical protein ACOMHN_037052 [Nucella lapillus]
MQTMAQRSKCPVLAGLTVLAIGAGGQEKRQLWTDARELGVKLVIVDSDPDHPARHLVDTFLPLDISDHTQDAQHVQTIVRALRAGVWERGVAGCLTWVEDCVPLAAYVAQALGLPQAMSVEAALNAKSKHRTLAVLGQQGLQSSPQSTPAVYASPVVRVHTVQQVADALNKIPLPVVMKPEFTCRGLAVERVHSVDEAEQHMERVLNTLYSEQGQVGSEAGLSYGPSMVLMPLLVGTEHDLDLVLFEGEVVTALVMDNGPIHQSSCVETASLMPSILPKEQQQQLIEAAAACCEGVGLRTGVFGVEMMLTPCGPRLIEINARMAGFYVRDWIQILYNVDLFHLALMCACGIRPVLPQACSLEEDPRDCGKDGDRAWKQRGDSTLPKGYIMGINLLRSRHGKALATTASPERLQRLHQEGQIIFCDLKNDAFTHPFDQPRCSVAVHAPDLYEARAKLVSVCTQLGLETQESVLELLAYFV